ncbi:hypothetical protein PU634_03725 [Oceanimonas pelagia]|uniref:Cation transporter n=2 Tax=Aeromonadaceae TaxID=84642 RepID=A0A2P7R423_9GAMM|nr:MULTISPECIES: hypothetical protein [Aeromonadaceae]PSJ44970.1 hypothetical protein C7I36_05725 [Zobellella taiwanensis]WMC11480.1 hypothetical protein PU634_03725 [Oceanimonas pelagia]
MANHRAGINPGFLTTHTLSLTEMSRANMDAMLAEIEAQHWVDTLALDSKTKKLKVAYEASSHNIDDIIDIIEQHGAALKDSWWSRTKLGWQRQTDENIKNNAKHEPHCCNKAPPGH